MKGFVFTLDALFALMIAAIGIAIVFYFAYTAPTPYMIQNSASVGLISTLGLSSLSQISSIPLLGYVVNQSAASNQTWPMQYANQYNNAGNGYGPSSLMLAYVINANAPIINGTIVAGYGNVYFGAGNTIYAINATTGSVIWTSNTPYNSIFGKEPYVNATLLYSGMLIYATNSNVVALNALNGTVIWGSNPEYGSQSTEPASTDLKTSIIQYGGRIIGYTFDTANSLSSTVYSMYANNGTLAGYSPLYANQVNSQAIANGQYLLTTPQGKVMLYTSIINNTFGAVPIWTLSPTCGGVGYPNGVLSFSNVIVYGCGTTGNIISTGSSSLFTASLPSSVTGLTAYNNHIIFQTSNAISMANPTSTIWTTPMSAYGSAILNATPVSSLQNVYSLWSGKYLVAQNLSTGNVIENASLPYSGMINPHMVLAYGRLFVSQGAYLMSFGSCPSSSNASALSIIGSLYINGQASCANYLIDKLQNNSNTAMSINGTTIINAAQFNGYSSSVNTHNNFGSSPSLISVTLWINPSNVPSAAELPFTDEWAQQISWINTGCTGSGGCIGGTTNAADWIYDPSALSPGKWYFVALTGSNTIGDILYVNGAEVAANTIGTVVGGSSNIWMGSTGEANGGAGCCNYAYSGGISDVQIYDTVLSSSEINSLYLEGIGGAPIDPIHTVGWWPLQSDANNYAGSYSAGFPANVVFTSANYIPPSLQNSFSISSQSVPLTLFNYTTGKYKLYNIGVYSWK